MPDSHFVLLCLQAWPLSKSPCSCASSLTTYIVSMLISITSSLTRITTRGNERVTLAHHRPITIQNRKARKGRYDTRIYFRVSVPTKHIFLSRKIQNANISAKPPSSPNLLNLVSTPIFHNVIALARPSKPTYPCNQDRLSPATLASKYQDIGNKYVWLPHIPVSETPTMAWSWDWMIRSRVYPLERAASIYFVSR